MITPEVLEGIRQRLTPPTYEVDYATLRADALCLLQALTEKPARDAEHCDYPDCEQHNAYVVADLRRQLAEAREQLNRTYDALCDANEFLESKGHGPYRPSDYAASQPAQKYCVCGRSRLKKVGDEYICRECELPLHPDNYEPAQKEEL